MLQSKITLHDLPRTQLVSHTIWKVINDCWTCISEPCNQNLIQFLGNYGFGDLPDTITYCIADNRDYKLKFRCSGSKIDVLICKKLLLK